ncbi:50S ribosomal protein L14e [compost metagenome]
MKVKHLKVAQLGQLVKVLKGRDAGDVYVIIGFVDDKFVLIADGNRRKFDQPKRKNLQHLELQPMISGEVVQSLQECGFVTNGKLRFAVNAFTEFANSNAEEKGD